MSRRNKQKQDQRYSDRKLVLVKRLKVKKIIRKSQNSTKNWSKKIVKKFRQNKSSTISSKNFVKILVKKIRQKLRQKNSSKKFVKKFVKGTKA